MPDEPVLTPAQIEKQKEEERIKNQTQFDPKLHGVGTIPDSVPESLAAFHKEYTAVMNSVLSRLVALEKELYSSKSLGMGTGHSSTFAPGSKAK
jgi:hypothetical protein